MQSSASAEWKVRASLREATAAVHERLHQAPPFLAIAQQRLGRCEYADLLGTIARFHFTIAAGLRLDGARQELLRDDLRALGVPLPTPVGWPAPATAAAKLGSAYVVEGSALGGKVIYRQLDYLFGPSVGGRRFFRGSASDAERWRSLCRRLEVEGQGDGALDELIAGARRAFSLFQALLVEPAYARA